MKITCNGVPIPIGTTLQITAECDPAGETLPDLTLTGVGGLLSIYKSKIHVSGNATFSFFGEGEENEVAT